MRQSSERFRLALLFLHKKQGGTMDEQWLDESISWSAENLIGMHYITDQDDWEEFKNSVEEFVQNYLEELNYE